MLDLPSTLARHRLATAKEVHRWSYGAVSELRKLDAADWRERKGTLDDQSVFGPLADDACACGKYRGHEYRGMICDRCGVKVTTTAVRRERFGHIDLPAPIPHPLGSDHDVVTAIPVLPAAYWESKASGELINVYEFLIKGAKEQSAADLRLELKRLVEILMPAALTASAWNLADAAALARGLVLADVDEEE